MNNPKLSQGFKLQHAPDITKSEANFNESIQVKQEPYNVTLVEWEKFFEEQVVAEQQYEDMSVKLEQIMNDELDIKEETSDLDLNTNSSEALKVKQEYDVPLFEWEQLCEEQVVTEQQNEDISVKFEPIMNDEEISAINSLDAEELATDSFKVKQFECYTCQGIFTKRKYFIRHLKKHAERKLFECKLCEKHFIIEASYKKHLQHHIEGKSFKCGICGYRTMNRNLKRHILTHTREKPYKCNTCDYRSAYKVSLERHIRTHTGETPYMCKICNQSFASNRNLNYHAAVHMKVKPFKCEICKYKTTRKKYLKLHCLKIHIRENLLKCNTCRSTFEFKDDFAEHLKTHSKEGRFECHMCNSTFANRRCLVQHAKLHSDRQPYHCQLCHFRSAHKASLIRHMDRHAEGCFICTICNRQFLHKHQLTLHVKTHIKNDSQNVNVYS